MDRRSTVRINAEWLRASLKAGSAEAPPAPAEAATEADQAMDRAIAGLTGVAEKLRTFDLMIHEEIRLNMKRPIRHSDSARMFRAHLPFQVERYPAR